MPSTVNGCGTWYYGKRNVQRYQGVCRACGRYTTLTSYDTGLYVVVVFLPILPLGRKRIIEQCAACTRHVAMSLGDWNSAQRRADEAISAYRASPADPELARDALKAVASYRNLNGFLGLAPEIERHLAGDAKVLCLVAAVYDLFSYADRAEYFYRKALEAADEDEIREALADALLRQGKPDEAEPYLRHIVVKGVPDRVDHLYALAQGYQMKGRHEKALSVFAECEAVNPLLANDRTFVLLREASAANVGSAKPVKPNDVVRKVKRATNWRKTLRVGPVVLALAMLAYAGLSWVLATRREVYLVSGVARPYTVRVNGTDHRLGPGEIVPIRVGEGDVKVQVIDPPPGLETGQTVRVQTPFVTRPFRSHTIVINPDAAAILQRQRITYGSPSRPPAGPESSIAAGQVLYRFDGIDYPFEAPPHSIQASEGSSGVSREALSIGDSEQVLSPAAMLLGIAKEVGNDAAARVARNRLLFDPEGREYPGVIRTLMAPAEAAQVLRTGLSARPPRIEWHRAYQDAMKAARRGEAIEREYDALLAAEPANKALTYLAARASRDLEKELTLLDRAADDPAPCGYAFLSRCGYRLCIADFEGAASDAELAVKMIGGHSDINWYCRRALLAAGRYQAVLDIAKGEESEPPPGCLTAFSDEVYAHTMLRLRRDADADLTRLETRLEKFGEEAVRESSAAMRAEREYVAGNAGEFVSAMGGSSGAGDRAAAHLTAGDLSAAEEDIAGLAESGESDAVKQRHLLMFLAATVHHRPDLAARHLDEAVKRLAEGDDEDRAFAAALKAAPGRSPTGATALLRLRVDPREKAVLLAAMGLRDPASRDAYFALARKLNYDRRFPYLLLNEVLNAPALPH